MPKKSKAKIFKYSPCHASPKLRRKLYRTKLSAARKNSSCGPSSRPKCSSKVKGMAFCSKNPGKSKSPSKPKSKPKSPSKPKRSVSPAKLAAAIKKYSAQQKAALAITAALKKYSKSKSPSLPFAQTAKTGAGKVKVGEKFRTPSGVYKKIPGGKWEKM